MLNNESETSMKSVFVCAVAITGPLLFGGAMAADAPSKDKYIKMPDLARKLNCTACHDTERKVVGPAWKEVAKKYHGQATYVYKGKEYPLIDGLVMKVSQGGAGNWGSMPMPPNDPSGVRKSEITELIKFEQSLWDK
jgi:cytochrome c